MAWEIRAINRLGFKKFLVLASAAVLLISFPFFFLGGALESSSQLMSAWWDLGHVAFFAALAVLVCNFFTLSWRLTITLSAAVFVGGGLIELIQSAIGRDGNWQDLLRDLMATWCALLWLAPKNVGVWFARASVTGVLLANFDGAFYESWHYVHSKNAFPLLAGFESNIETYGLNRDMMRTRELHSQGEYALRVKLSTKLYSGIKFARLQRDWRGFEKLSVDIYNADAAPFMMSIRVNDGYHKRSGWDNSDRYNHSFKLQPGWNQLHFPLAAMQAAPASRKMDMSDIAWLEFFVGKLPEPKIIYVDNLRLE